MDPDTAPDEEILAQFRRARPAQRRALADRLFARHYERVGRWCLRVTGDRELAADVAQDVFVKAYKALDQFRGEARFSTWLYTIARREAFSAVRARRQTDIPADVELLDELPSPDEGPEVALSRASDGRYAHGLLQRTLDDTERAVFVLHFGDGLPLDAVTRMLGLTNLSGAKAHVVSAKRKLARAVHRITARGDRR